MLPYSLLEDERAIYRGRVPRKTSLEVLLLSLYNRLDSIMQQRFYDFGYGRYNCDAPIVFGIRR